MNKNKTSALKMSAVAIGLTIGSINTGYAFSQGSSQYVENVDISLPGMAAVITIENTSANKHVNAINLQVKESKMDFEVGGHIKCDGSNMEALATLVFYGPVSISGAGINDSATLHKSDINISEAVNNDPVEYVPPSIFSVPLNKVKNGHPALRVDALEELNKKLQAHIQGGGTALEFYQQDQDIVLKRPLSVSGACRKQNNPYKASSGYETKNHTIQIKYKGDPAINEKPVINAQLGQANLPNQVQQNPNLPFQLNDVQFQPNLPNYVGKCLPDQNPNIRMNFTIAGGKQGIIDLRVKAVSNQYADYGHYFVTSGIVKKPENGGGHLDFSFPLKEMLSQQKYSWMMTLNNKTYNHNMQIEARYKNFDGSNEWSNWQQYDHAVYKHRCTPQLNGQLGQGNNGGIGGYNDGNNGSDDGQKILQQTLPDSQPKRLNRAEPEAPKRLKRAEPVEPAPLRMKAPTPAETQPLDKKPVEPVRMQLKVSQ